MWHCLLRQQPGGNHSIMGVLCNMPMHSYQLQATALRTLAAHGDATRRYHHRVRPATHTMKQDAYLSALLVPLLPQPGTAGKGSQKFLQDNVQQDTKRVTCDCKHTAQRVSKEHLVRLLAVMNLVSSHLELRTISPSTELLPDHNVHRLHALTRLDAHGDIVVDASHDLGLDIQDL
jgi:hypothetical protein